ncbi:hypothetical protein B0J12DRAFT_636192 [Macrophomina phaseolina]|uniref:Uncharacterized protein n=1 Tax=Macrophomina phaseolina TaxID=35725 RepID=A0ABQ8FQC9_9PEZI|nr:hypothetical protein B0J12DRAFT_636192 [Macrophomina phaseolina]
MSSLNVATPHKKPRKDKQRQPPPRKTDRRQIPTETRAFLVGALFASAGGGVTKHSLATTTKIRKGTIQRIEARAQQRAQEADLPLWDPYNFQDELRGKEQLLDAEDKRKIATAVTSGRTELRIYQSPSQQ